MGHSAGPLGWVNWEDHIRGTTHEPTAPAKAWSQLEKKHSLRLKSLTPQLFPFSYQILNSFCNLYHVYSSHNEVLTIIITCTNKHEGSPTKLIGSESNYGSINKSRSKLYKAVFERQNNWGRLSGREGYFVVVMKLAQSQYWETKSLVFLNQFLFGFLKLHFSFLSNRECLDF